MEIKLEDWTIHFVKNKDLIARKLINYEEKEGFILFHFKDKDVKYYVKEHLDATILSLIKEDCFKTIVCLADKKNLDFLIDNWDLFKGIETLSLLFVRMSDNAKWIINPFVHSKICDDSALKLGLTSMYDNTF
ncbi:MAG: hypothetical protein KJ583_05795 [Nanoarchaeota archaeon]|nr:hypothetical protein [Nanoarchaeota archaeon]MBU1270438.1 hypothetical protein [Nanoarchaeota archaeon]MBU1604799.1 hypothetical protein [Nanoarchaeota archaeon]MBU2443215.1 hypothetical protein [Nanoarchaeota archaeon]